MAWVKVGTKSVTVSIGAPSQLPDVVTWGLSTSKEEYAPGEDIVLYITVLLVMGLIPCPCVGKQ